MNALEMVCLFTVGFALGFLFCAIINGALKSAAHAPDEAPSPLMRWYSMDILPLEDGAAVKFIPNHANYKARCDAQRWADFDAVESHGQRLARLKGGK